jgi:tRNA pseudouridine55 synthase
MDGILNIDKPAGITSYGVVARIKRLSGEKRVGHAGTLDPAATGVLPVCLGRATRVVEYIMGAAKTYRAVIELGTVTDTYDAAGTIVQCNDPSRIDRPTLEAALDSFRGEISQTPPMYSAVKHGGRPLYALARAGQTVKRASRPVKVYRLEMLDWRPPRFTLEVTCGKGTYIRSLAHDLGQALGCGAHLAELERTRYGRFDVRDAVTLATLEEAFMTGDWRRFVLPVDFPLSALAAVFIGGEDEVAMKKGQLLHVNVLVPPGGPEICRAYAEDGRFLGILRREPGAGAWRPEQVLG